MPDKQNPQDRISNQDRSEELLDAMIDAGIDLECDRRIQAAESSSPSGSESSGSNGNGRRHEEN